MASRRGRARRRVTLLVAALVAFVAAALLAGVVEAAHRSAPYRRTVDQSFAAAASALMVSSNTTGIELARVIGDPGALGRPLLESRLQHLDQAAADESRWAASLVPPPPDANAANRVIDTLRLRARATASIRATLEGLLGLTPLNPVGTSGAEPGPARPVGVPGAEGLLRYAGQQLVLADRIYHGLPVLFATVSGGATLPLSAWTSPRTGRLMPATLEASASRIASDPRLAPTVALRIAAVQTTPLLLPIGPGYPIPPTTTLDVSISVVNRGSAPTRVIAIIRVRPTGALGHFDSGVATGAVAADGAVALTLPTMSVVPGGHFLVSVELVRPRRQTTSDGLLWERTVVVGKNAPVG